MKLAILQASVVSVCALLLSACAEKEVSFKADIQPILVKNCLECHAAGGAGAEKSGPVAARAELYAGRKVVVTPLEATYLIWLDCRALELEQEELMRRIFEARFGVTPLQYRRSKEDTNHGNDA